MPATTRQATHSGTRLLDRAERILQREISFIYCKEFESLTEAIIELETPSPIHDPSTAASQEEPASAIPGMNSPLLTPAGERHLFRKLNFLKFRANALRSRLNPRRPQERDVIRIELLLAEAEQARTDIIQANLRLVASLAHKFAHNRADFDDLTSEGHLILVVAVDKFDYSRGFRFSTYATHSLQRHFYRLLQRKQRRKSRELSAGTDALVELAVAREQDPLLDYRLAESLIEHFDECLDSRERMIIEARYGLSPSFTSDTLKSVAEQVGLSKERVRQLQLRALDKLQDLALRLNLRLEPNL